MKIAKACIIPKAIQYCKERSYLILEIGHSELSIVSDFVAPIEIQEQFYSFLNEHEISYSSYSVQELRYLII